MQLKSRHGERTMTNHLGRFALCSALSLAIATTLSNPAAAQVLYVSNEGSNTVTVVSPTTMQQLATIAVGNRPRGIALSPDGRHAYVALGREDAVAVIDVATRRVTDKVP